MKSKILIVEDDPIMAERYALDLKDYDVTAVGTGSAAEPILDKNTPDIAILDVRLPDTNGIDILRRIRSVGLPTEVVIITSHGSVNMAVEAMQAGARDFLVKPFSPDRLRVTVDNVLETQRLSRQVEALTEELREERPGRFHGFIGNSPAMRGVYRMIEAAAPSKATVFITGESGTGKELCAEAVHRASPRADGPFIAVNCAAIPKDLMESELFGHVKGAFTGATSTREGAASMADGGTMFLDEICEMDISLQSKLLRFLQTGQVQRVGSDTLQKVDIRVVCATNRDPLREVEEGRFREDLYYRLHVVPIHLPPLRERPGDALEIAKSFLGRMDKEENKAFQRIASSAAAAIAAYDWPGNVRQLENVLRQAIVLNDGDDLEVEMLPPPLSSMNLGEAPLSSHSFSRPSSVPPSELHQENGSQAIRPLWQVERDAIEAAIALCDDNVPKAAALLEISPSTIYRKRAMWDEETVPRP